MRVSGVKVVYFRSTVEEREGEGGGMVKRYKGIQ